MSNFRLNQKVKYTSTNKRGVEIEENSKTSNNVESFTDEQLLKELNRRKILPLSQQDVLDNRRCSDHYKTEKSFIGGLKGLNIKKS